MAILPSEPPARTPAQQAQAVYERLQAHYGPREWGPRQGPLEELIFTVLSQNTSDINTFRTFASLQKRFPTWKAVMKAAPGEVADAIKMGGLSQIKAPRIQAILRDIEEKRGDLDLGFLEGMPLEEARRWLIDLPGVGPKTAACVLLFSLGMPALPVDTHVHRVAKRLGLIGEKMPADKAHPALEALVRPDQVYDFHMDLIEHGRRVCHAQRPKCEACVLNDICPSSRTRADGSTGAVRSSPGKSRRRGSEKSA
jgi:endonuclease-3